MYCTNHSISPFVYKRENMEIYAGATEETSVFDVDTSEPSSTSLPKSFIMQTRNCRGDNRRHDQQNDRTFKHKTCDERDSRAHLPVHEDVDNWIVNGGALGKVRRHGSGQRMEGISRVSRSETGKEGVRSPTHAECHNHDNHHPGHFFLSFLGGFRFLLLHGNLWLTGGRREKLRTL